MDSKRNASAMPVTKRYGIYAGVSLFSCEYDQTSLIRMVKELQYFILHKGRTI